MSHVVKFFGEATLYGVFPTKESARRWAADLVANQPPEQRPTFEVWPMTIVSTRPVPVLRWFRVDKGRNKKVSRVAVIGAVMSADSSLTGFGARERVVNAEASGARVVTARATFEPRLVNEPEDT